MTFDNFTIRAQEALQNAVQRASELRQQSITPAHLLHGIMDVGENVTQFLFGKTGVNAQVLASTLERHLQSLPRVEGG